jgi:hypothetical protein
MVRFPHTIYSTLLRGTGLQQNEEDRDAKIDQKMLTAQGLLCTDTALILVVKRTRSYHKQLNILYSNTSYFIINYVIIRAQCFSSLYSTCSFLSQCHLFPVNNSQLSPILCTHYNKKCEVEVKQCGHASHLYNNKILSRKPDMW